MIDNGQFMTIGIIIALVVGVTAVFLASGDPDGLESTALVVQDEKGLLGVTPEDADPEAIGEGTFEYESPLPDYSMGEAAGKGGDVVALVIGIFITFALIAGVTWAITSKPSKS